MTDHYAVYPTVAPAPGVTITSVAGNSISITWSAATPSHLNGDIQRYDVRYRIVAPESEEDYTIVSTTETGLSGEVTITSLATETAFEIQVWRRH